MGGMSDWQDWEGAADELRARAGLEVDPQRYCGFAPFGPPPQRHPSRRLKLF